MKPGDRIPVYVATKTNWSGTIIKGQCFSAHPIDEEECYLPLFLDDVIDYGRAKQIGTLIIKKVK